MDDPRPYVQMAAVIRKQILDGDLQQGDPTPTITELAATYGHARPTCAHALHMLEAEGFVTRIPGHGYFVGQVTTGANIMVTVNANDAMTKEELHVQHEVHNKGKLTEEHHFFVRVPGCNVPRVYFIMGRDDARELKAHI